MRLFPGAPSRTIMVLPIEARTTSTPLFGARILKKISGN